MSEFKQQMKDAEKHAEGTFTTWRGIVSMFYLKGNLGCMHAE